VEGGGGGGGGVVGGCLKYGNTMVRVTATAINTGIMIRIAFNCLFILKT